MFGSAQGFQNLVEVEKYVAHFQRDASRLSTFLIDSDSTIVAFFEKLKEAELSFMGKYQLSPNDPSEYDVILTNRVWLDLAESFHAFSGLFTTHPLRRIPANIMIKFSELVAGVKKVINSDYANRFLKFCPLGLEQFNKSTADFQSVIGVLEGHQRKLELTFGCLTHVISVNSRAPR